MLNSLEQIIKKLEYTNSVSLAIENVLQFKEDTINKIQNIQSLTNNELMKLYYIVAICEFRVGDYNEGLKYLEEFNIYANINKNHYYMNKYFYWITFKYIINKKEDKFKEIYNTTINYLKRENLYEDIVMYNLRIARYIHIYFKRKEDVKYYLSQGKSYLNQCNQQNIADIYISIAAVHLVRLSDVKTAIELLLKSLKYSSAYEQYDKEIVALYYLGESYNVLSIKREAINIYTNILTESKYDEYKRIKAIVILGLIDILLEQNDLQHIDSLFTYYDKIIDSLTKANRNQFITKRLALFIKYQLLIDNKDYDNILSLVDECRSYYQSGNSYFSLIDYILEDLYGIIYYKMGTYDKALDHQNKALDISKHYDSKYQTKAHLCLSDTYNLLRDYENALYHIEKSYDILYDIENRDLKDKYIQSYADYEKLKLKEQEKRAFFTTMSHELKTPINIIYSSLQLMDIYKDKSDDEFVKNYSKHENSIVTNCLRMSKLVNNIIDINRIDLNILEANFGNYNLVELIKNIAYSVISSTEVKGIDILFNCEFESIIIKCDPFMIERIILNLLSNAIKFTKENGIIKINIYKDTENIIIEVADNGIGISKNMLSEIFKQFVQVDKSLKRKHEGSGIGLSLVKSLIEIHGGDIKVKSKYNHGSIFTITLPNITLDYSSELYIENYKVNSERVLAELSDIYY